MPTPWPRPPWKYCDNGDAALTQARKERADVLLVERGLAESRQRAQALIMAGVVSSAGKRIDKPGQLIPAEAELAVAQPLRYVSRGGLKLEAALQAFDVDVRGKVAIDVGASTGGFTDCLLQHGAARVYAVDVGHGQLDWRLRQDPRVVNIERQNVRYISAELIPERLSLATIDVSFISLTLALPPVLPLLSGAADIIALVKPQFELTAADVPKGVVRDEAKRREALEKIKGFAAASGLEVLAEMESPLSGPKGNREFLLHLRLPA
jgi:23S rRNA (cytidine1920-2'-O)/16S rRNA (cytidine1409-2'-O)-methyltransferase